MKIKGAPTTQKGITMAQPDGQRCENCYFNDKKTGSGNERYTCRFQPPIKYRDDNFRLLCLLPIAVLLCGAVLAGSGWRNIDRTEDSIAPWVGSVLIVVGWMILQVAYWMLVRQEGQATVEPTDWCGQWRPQNGDQSPAESD